MSHTCDAENAVRIGMCGWLWAKLGFKTKKVSMAN